MKTDNSLTEQQISTRFLNNLKTEEISIYIKKEQQQKHVGPQV